MKLALVPSGDDLYFKKDFPRAQYDDFDKSMKKTEETACVE